MVTSDHWSAYGRLDVYRRQLCWAHRKRDFQGLVDRSGPGRPLGEALPCFTEDVFIRWYRVRDGTLRRTTPRASIDEHWPRCATS